MSVPLIKGWCPGAHRPMQAADGWILRVRPWLSRLTAVQALGLADTCERFGTGSVELTSRANVQIRGISECDLEDVKAALGALEMLDRVPGQEARRNLIVAPDGRSLEMGDAVQDAVIAFPGPLPQKFGAVVDCGDLRTYGAAVGDIRVEAATDGLIVRADASPTGRLCHDAGEVAAAVKDLLHWFSAEGIGPDGRGRMAQCVDRLPAHLRGDAEPLGLSVMPLAPHHVGAVFGTLTASALRHLAQNTENLCVTPYRSVRVDAPIPDHPDLMASPNDPRAKLLACPGAPGCAQAQGVTRALALQLAGRTEGALHVSGCAKGCAHPRRASVTVVATATGYDLVRNGAPWDAPVARGLRVDDLLGMAL